MPQTYLTPEGVAKLRAELIELIEVKRPALSARLREAIQMGDLSENADYIMAKEDQAFLEGRIIELQTLLSSAIIVNENAPAGDQVAMGNTVTVLEAGSAVPESFTIVGAKEADPRAGRISNESPIGKALLGRRIGDIAKAHTPGGVIEFKVQKIE